MNPPSPPDPTELRAMLLDARERTLALTLDLDEPQLLGPRLAIVNPPLWELGHVAWFQERWCLRHTGSGALRPSILSGADALYDSSNVPHETRWDLPLPDRQATLRYMADVLEGVLERLERGDSTLEYFAQLAAFHEDMHGEALTYTRQTLGYARPVHVAPNPASSAGPWPGDALVPGGSFMLGAAPDSGFVFDNEKWAHEIVLEPYRISRAPVTNGEYAAFVEDGGYERRPLWSEAGWEWRVHAAAQAPAYWIRHKDGWLQRVFDELAPLPPHVPVMHTSWFEAEAYCNWAGRRLPSEAEWEMAAAADPGAAKRRCPWGDEAPGAQRAHLDGWTSGCVDVAALPQGDSPHGCRQMLGNVWEWTADAFQPYPGFAADPYRDYSQPWFGTHRSLRGGCFATRARLVRNTLRNFYTPDRRDIFAGFRTCAAVNA